MLLFKSRKTTCKSLLCFIIPILFGHSGAFCQTNPLRSELLKLIARSDSVKKNYPAEKIYMQFDKPYYALGDTIWFKAWVFNAPTYLLSAQSAMLHMDIANDSNRVIKQYLFPIEQGLSWNNIVLNEKDFQAGNYTIRAYTNWMRNFGDAGFYYKHIQLTDDGENSWLVNTHITNDKNTVNAQLQLADVNKIPIVSQSILVRVMEDKKSLYKKILQTDKKGMLDVSFNLHQNAHDIIIAENLANDHKVSIPVNLNPYDNVDLQFMPEGGNMVAGVKTHVGFKAIGEDGRGMDVSGKIIDNNKEVASFQSLHNGMGSFDLLPQSGATYTARITMAGGPTKDFPLPDVKSSGTALQLNNSLQKDSITVMIESMGVVKPDENYFLVGKSRDVICYVAAIDLHNDIKVEKQVAKSLFPSGIAHFILLNAEEQSLNERLTFIDHHDNLHINIAPDQTAYGVKDSVALHVTVRDTSGKPLAGNFSLAVTDDAYVKIDSLDEDNILTHLLLSSDLKGYVEQPGYYFQKSTASWRALDNLVLTQGWASYEAVSATMPYKAEKEFIVTGIINNDFHRPVKDTRVTLFSKSPSILMDTVTDNEGYFSFRHFPRVDTPIFLLKAVNKKGKSSNVNINIDEPQPPVFHTPKLLLKMPWYVNTDSIITNYVKNDIAFQKLNEYLPDGNHHLKEVKIMDKKFVMGSRNLNGPGNADIILDEKDLEKAGKKSFQQLLEENIKGFRAGFVNVFSGDHKSDYAYPAYFINMKRVIILFDGIPFYSIYRMTFDEFKRYLQRHTAEDIKGIEVMTSEKLALRYKSWLFPDAKLGVFDFIEITTRSGHGPVIDNVPGMYLYKPLAISWPVQFYKPKYTVKDTTHRSDLRSTIDWDPNIATDNEGKATIWFYAGQKPSTYTLILEGTDFKGNLGYKRQRIVINKKTESAKSK